MCFVQIHLGSYLLNSSLVSSPAPNTFPSQLLALYLESPLSPVSTAILSIGISHLLEHGRPLRTTSPRITDALCWGSHQLSIVPCLQWDFLTPSHIHAWIFVWLHLEQVLCMSLQLLGIHIAMSLSCPEYKVSLQTFHSLRL